MEFFKNFFSHDKIIIGLSGLRKSAEFIKITIPEYYKKTHIITPGENYLLY